MPGFRKLRVEKLLEDALIKLSVVASDIFGVSGRAMLEALIGGERDPVVLAKMARGRMRPKHGALVEALNGRFDDHHAELARMLLDQIDSLSAKIEALTTRIGAMIDIIGAAAAPVCDDADADPVPDAGTMALSALDRLDEVPGIGVRAAQVVIAEIGLNMGQFPTSDHLSSWVKLSPRTIQSGSKTRPGRTGKGNCYLKAVLGEAAIAAAKTDTFLGERYRRLVRRCGKHQSPCRCRTIDRGRDLASPRGPDRTVP